MVRAITQQFHAHGLAGCVVIVPGPYGRRRMGLYVAEQAKMDAEGGPWVTVCEDHGTNNNHWTRKEAEAHLALADWCEACQAEMAAIGVVIAFKRANRPCETPQRLAEAQDRTALLSAEACAAMRVLIPEMLAGTPAEWAREALAARGEWPAEAAETQEASEAGRED